MRNKNRLLSKVEKEELSKIMSIGNTALKQCAEMMGLNRRAFRGKLFNGKLDTSKLSPEQLQKLNDAKPLIFAVKDKCEEKVRNGFKRMVMQQANFAARNNVDPYNAKQDFAQEGDLALLDATYGYTNLNNKLSTYVWQCVRRRIFESLNDMNPFCPLTNEALNLVRGVQDIKKTHPEIISDEQAVEILGLSSSERDVFFSAITKVVQESTDQSTDFNEKHNDDYTANRRGVDRDFKETFFIRKEARQAIKNADLNGFELACLLGSIFPYHGWQEDIASKFINNRTGERYTRQNIQHILERATKKVRNAYLHPPKVELENSVVDKFFEEWDAERAVEEDQQSRVR